MLHSSTVGKEGIKDRIQFRQAGSRPPGWRSRLTGNGKVPSWELRDADRELFERELESFVPDRIFDAHAHLYEKWYFPEGSAHRHNLQHAPEQCGLREFRELSGWITPRRQVDALFL